LNDQGLISRTVRDFFSLHHVHTSSGATQPPTQWVLGAFPQGQSSWSMKLTTHLHLGLRLRMCRTITPLPIVRHKDNFSYFYFLIWLLIIIIQIFTFHKFILHIYKKLLLKEISRKSLFLFKLHFNLVYL
jgi:hypothetical protein